ncbi:tyrosine-type recombinase/integrase [Sporocytophaga myxococcoides]|uniref:tyrosine-type recombinase/integrase n=1 Tax=Sporocytophaga myxococcoides TaxID=153721 RepID=UPI000404737E|nr:site-specific integrase [Sporocytophaga myxococcoides]
MIYQVIYHSYEYIIILSVGLMNIIYCKFSNGLRFPILKRVPENIPYILPFTFSIICLKGKSNKTIINTVSSIKIFYQFFAELNIDIEEEILNGNFAPITEEIKNFCSWVYLGKYKSNKSNLPISNQSNDSHLAAIKLFLRWCTIRYKCDKDIRFSIDENLAINYIHQSPKLRSYRSLKPDEVVIIRNHVLPNSPTNPYRESLQIRNFLIIELLYKTGMRLGELLTLKVNDLRKNEDYHYLRIRYKVNDIEDNRRIKPSIKNAYSEREIGINQELYSLIEHYIKYNRKPKNKPLAHAYLITSERGNALSQNTLASLFKVLEMSLHTKGITFDIALTPHAFRHTFCELYLEYLIETLNIDMERAKDKLRECCGWSPNSVMPNFYASRYINKMANKANIERLNNKY